MGADVDWRCSEVVVDPLHDAAALFSVALAEGGDDVPLATAEDGEKAWWRRGVRLEGEIIAVDRHPNTVGTRDCKSIVDGHNRPLQAEGLRSGVAEVWADWSALSFLAVCSELTDEGQFISLTAASEEGTSAHKPAICFDQS